MKVGEVFFEAAVPVFIPAGDDLFTFVGEGFEQVGGF